MLGLAHLCGGFYKSQETVRNMTICPGLAVHGAFVDPSVYWPSGSHLLHIRIYTSARCVCIQAARIRLIQAVWGPHAGCSYISNAHSALRFGGLICLPCFYGSFYWVTKVRLKEPWAHCDWLCKPPSLRNVEQSMKSVRYGCGWKKIFLYQTIYALHRSNLISHCYCIH